SRLPWPWRGSRAWRCCGGCVPARGAPARRFAVSACSVSDRTARAWVLRARLALALALGLGALFAAAGASARVHRSHSPDSDRVVRRITINNDGIEIEHA